MKVIVAFLIIAITISLGLGQACSKNGSQEAKSSPITNSSVTGKLTSRTLAPSNKPGTLSAPIGKTITHIMAVAPSTGNAERFVAEVGEDGTFNLNLNSGHPYILVFIAQNGVLTGPDMIAGSINLSANNLDTLPLKQAASIGLGDVTLDNNLPLANSTLSTSTTELLAQLGLSTIEANYLGATDDLALRLANPDIDMNGTIDALEGKNFGLDWHIRADTLVAGSELVITQIENQYANENLLSLRWSLGSAYAVYPRSFDDVEYTNAGALTNGGAFTDSSINPTPTSYSGGTFADKRQWGPDYDMTSQELGGSSSSATFTYFLGSKTLKFSNVRTKTKVELQANGILMPFIQVNTQQGKITGISYKWMKRYGSNWTEASATEVSLLVQDSGAMLRLYTAKTPSSESGLNFIIPNSSSSGVIRIGDPNNQNEGVADIQNVSLTDICSSALSYDDKMGLRIFAGAPKPAASVTPCY